jgi:hypothetical protein
LVLVIRVNSRFFLIVFGCSSAVLSSLRCLPEQEKANRAAYLSSVIRYLSFARSALFERSRRDASNELPRKDEVKDDRR